MSHHRDRHLAQAQPEAEDSRLDQAIARADDILVASLKREEVRRWRRRLLLFSGGGLAMILVALLAWAGFAGTQGLLFNAQSGLQPVVGQTANGGRAAQIADEGWQLWQKQQFAAAIDKFELAVKLDPKNLNAWNGLGWARFNSGEYEPAEAAFKKVVSAEPQHAAALNGLGQIAFAQRKYGEAEKHLLKAAPQAPAAWYGLAKLYLLQGKYDQAAKWAEKIVAQAPADEGAKQMLQAARDKHLPDALKRQIEPNPEQAEVTRGWQAMNSGRQDEARAIFEAVLKKSPESTAALNGMGWLSLNLGRLDEAKVNFEKALAIDPLASGSMNGLARVLHAKGDVDGAVKIWQTMVDKIPGPHAGTFSLANVYLERGEFKKAVPLLEVLAKAEPQSAQIREMLERARAGAKAN